MWRRRRAEDEFSEEFNAHIELQTRKYLLQGMDPREAHRRASVEFGGVEKAREECREVSRWSWADANARNLTHCLRSLERSPAFASVLLLLLTIGIASNVAVFSTIDALFLRPLPIERPGEMVRVGTLDKDGRTGGLPSTTLDALQNNRLFSGICGVDTRYAAAELAGGMRTLGMAGFSGDCFRTLGIRMQLGRGIGPGDERPNAERVAVITGSLWHDAFGGRPDALGRTIRIEDGLFTIVGVTEDRFTGLLVGFPEPVMIPLRQQPDLAPNGRRATYWWVSIFGRRAAGVSYARALSGIAAQGSRLLEQGVPPNYNALRRKNFLAQKLTVTPAKNGFDYFLGRRFGDSLYAVFGLCGAILLMACVSLTSLLLARSLSRHREVAIRLAVGARRGHIATIFILENAVLLVGGALAGSVLGLWSARVILDRGGRMFGNFRLETGFDWRVVVFLGAVLLMVLGVFTAASIWQAARLGGGGILANNTRAQKILLGAQIALSLVLVSGATLFGASLRNTYAIDFGIQPRNVWNVVLAPRPAGYRNFAPAPYYRDLLARIEALPGVVSASISHDVPFWAVSDKQPVAIIDSAEVQAQIMPIGDRFFETLGAKIAAGEDFRRTGDDARELSVVISQSLAGKLGGRGDLIGHHLRIGSETKYQRVKIAGIAADMDLSLVNPEDTRPFTVYTNFWQDRDVERYPVLLVRTAANQLDDVAVRRIVDGGGREYVEQLTSVTGEIDNALIENRLLAYLAGAFSVLALVIAAVGLFGLLSYQVSTRTAEIGLRMALGAKRAQVQWLFLRQVAFLLAIGIAVGAAATVSLQKAIAGLLYGARASDLPLLALSIAVLTATAVVTAWIPVRRASIVDPARALHHD